MKLETKEKLLKEYRGLKNPKETTAIKYWYQYKQVHVNIFFDSFDDENPNLSMVLVYDGSYYYTSLNINNTAISKEFLTGIPKGILNQILDFNNTLDDFFKNIEDHIAINKVKYINYEKDRIFSNTVKYSEKTERKDLPFLFGLRKVPMSNKMFRTLIETMSIDINILRKIQQHQMTIVRTSDPKKRKKLTVVLNEVFKKSKSTQTAVKYSQLES